MGVRRGEAAARAEFRIDLDSMIKFQYPKSLITIRATVESPASKRSSMTMTNILRFEVQAPHVQAPSCPRLFRIRRTKRGRSNI